MSVFGITTRFYIQLRRNPYTFVILLGLPAVMILMFGIAFSSVNSAGNSTYQIIVVNNDEGLDSAVAESFKDLSTKLGIEISNDTNNTIDSGLSSLLLDLMNTTKYPGEDTNRIFDITIESDLDLAKASVENRNYDALMVIPSDFSNTTLSAFNRRFQLETGLYMQNILLFQNLTFVSYPVTSNSTVQVFGERK